MNGPRAEFLRGIREHLSKVLEVEQGFRRLIREIRARRAEEAERQRIIRDFDDLASGRKSLTRVDDFDGGSR